MWLEHSKASLRSIFQILSLFTVCCDQRPHHCVARFHSLLCVPQLCRQSSSDWNTHEDVSPRVVVPHTATDLTTDKARQFLLLLTGKSRHQLFSSSFNHSLLPTIMDWFELLSIVNISLKFSFMYSTLMWDNFKDFTVSRKAHPPELTFSKKTHCMTSFLSLKRKFLAP